MAKEQIPEWAKNLKEWGERMEIKYGDQKDCHSEQSEESRPGSFAGAQDDKKRKPEWRKQSNPAGDLFGQLISYLIVTYVPIYFPGFFLTGWTAVYTVIVYSILVHVAVDVIQIFVKAKPIYYLGQAIANIAGLVSMVVMVTIFPFNFPGNLGPIVQFALWIAIGIVSVVTFFSFLKIFGPDC